MRTYHRHKLYRWRTGPTRYPSSKNKIRPPPEKKFSTVNINRITNTTVSIQKKTNSFNMTVANVYVNLHTCVCVQCVCVCVRSSVFICMHRYIHVCMYKYALFIDLRVTSELVRVRECIRKVTVTSSSIHYLYVYTYVCANSTIYMYVCKYTCINEFLYICENIYTHTHIYIWMCIYICMYIKIRIFIYLCVYIYIYIYIYICTYADI